MQTIKNILLQFSFALFICCFLMSFKHDCLNTFIFSVHHAELEYEQNSGNCGSGVGAYFCHLENGYQLDQSIDNAITNYDDCCEDEDGTSGCP